MNLPFLDTNILLRHFLQDHPIQSTKATKFLLDVEQGKIKVYTSDLVIFEVVFTLQRTYRLSKNKIQEAVLPLLLLPGIKLSGKRIYRRVFALYIEKNLPFADAYHVSLMEKLKINKIISFDKEFDMVEGISRFEP